MSESGPPRTPPPPRAAYPHVVAWGVLGLATTIVTMLVAAPWPAVRLGEQWLLPVIAITAIVLSNANLTSSLPSPLSSAISMGEAAVMPAIVLLHPGWAVLVAVLAESTSETFPGGKHPAKIVFNVGWTAVGTALGALAFNATWSGTLDSPRYVLAALLAALTYTLVNTVAVVMLFSAIGDAAPASLARLNLQTAIESMAMSAVGAVGAVVLIAAPWVLPLLAVPLLLARSRQRVRERAQRGLLEERDRFDRTIAGASDGIVLVDRSGTVRVWNAAAAALTDTPADLAVGRPVTQVLPLRELDGGPVDLDARLDERRRDASSHSWSAVTAATARAITVSASPDAAGEEVVLVLRDVSRQQELDQIREDLVSRVSHELRTPLATTTGFLETALGRWDTLTDQQRRDLLAIAHRSGKRLNRVVAGLLVRSRIEGAAATPHPRAVQVDAVIRDVLAEVGDTIAIPTHIVRADDMGAWVDPDHLTQIVENLLVNADRYGQGPVEISIVAVTDEVVVPNGPAGTHLRLEVRDHGPGVDPDFLPELFDAFTQASVGLQRTAEGLGLGLSIVRALAEANGGTVSYDDAPGGGALFTVTLPAAITLHDVPAPRDPVA